jgi:hypothetical protein
MSDFTAWLGWQTDRSDPVGALARDVDEIGSAGTLETPTDVRAALEEGDRGYDVDTAVGQALEEYRWASRR